MDASGSNEVHSSMDGAQHQPQPPTPPTKSAKSTTSTTSTKATTSTATAPTTTTTTTTKSIVDSEEQHSTNGDNEDDIAQQQIISVDDFMENLKQLFQECDTDNNGHLGRDKFKDLCLKIGLNENDSYETFDRLDIDRNGTITFEEFCAGFNQYQTNHSVNVNSDYCDDSSVKKNEKLSSLNSMKNSSNNGAPIYEQEDNNSHSCNSLDHLAANGCLMPEDNRRSLRSPSKLSTRGPRNRSRSSSSRVSPVGTISLGGRDNNDSSERNQAATGNVDNCNNDNNNDMIVLSNRDTAIGGSVFNGRQVMTMQDLLDCVQTLQDENHKLAVSLMKEKKDRDEYLSRLGEEMDQQVKEVEARVGQRAKEEVETERKRLREMMKAEFDGLQTHFQTLEKVNDWIKNTASGKTIDGEKIEKVKTKLEDSLSENRQLRMSLLNTQTNVAMIRSEIDQLKEQYEEKCQELTSERERVYETLNECDHIKRQLNLMHDSNRKLQDASDAITTYISDSNNQQPMNIKAAIQNNDDIPHHHLLPHHSGATPPMMPRNSSRHNLPPTGGAMNNSRRGSILSDYIQDLSLASDCGQSVSITSDLESLTSQLSAPARNHLCDDSDDRFSQRSVPNYKSTRAGSSGVYSNNSKQQTTTINSKSPNNHNQQQYLAPTAAQQNNEDTNNCYGQHQQQQVALKKSRSYQNIESKHRINSMMDGGQQQQHSIGGGIISDNGELTSLSMQSGYSIGLNESSTTTTRLDSLPSVDSVDGPPVTTYDIILVGDSYVGKSSFVARFMEGEFVVGIISNCGIDFKTKSYKIDGVNITINLWDTAGQERFRSITASYFRKADGIILMYDVTEKNSYLNVRNWMSTIMDTAAENVPVLLIGNKIDLRTQHNLKTCVPSEEGQRLAKEYDIVFLETSVKEGTNLTGSIKKLVRLMMARHQKPVESDDTIKLNDKSKTFRCMPQKC